MRMAKPWLMVPVIILAAVGLLVAQEGETDKAEADNSIIVMKLSGPGAGDETTIKAGAKVSLELHMSNEKPRREISIGFKLTSPDIEKIVHVMDSGNGINKGGDIKGYNGFENKSVFDMTGVLAAEKDWDGVLPDTIGFGALVIKNSYEPHEMMKALSIDLIVPTPGTLMIDSTFFPPGGSWQYGMGAKPGWGGPYTFKVVE